MRKASDAVIWQKRNKARVKAHKLAWYYRNRTIINTMYSKGDFGAFVKVSQG